MSFLKDLVACYGDWNSFRTDLRDDIKNSKDHAYRMEARFFLFLWWLLTLLVHAAVIGLPLGIAFVIAGYAGAYG